MTSELVTVHRAPDLVDPVLVVALDGWVDAGFGMRNAIEIMVQSDDAVPVASFDADLLVDHRARRPTMTVRDGRVDDISWPAIRLQVVSDLDQREFLMLHGPEPDFRWRAFCAAVHNYASGSPFPAATAALFQGLRAVTELRFDPAPLIAEGLEVSRRLDTMIAQNASHKRLLGQLESAYDTSMGEHDNEIPTGDELAEELERFLRDQDESK